MTFLSAASNLFLKTFSFNKPFKQHFPNLFLLELSLSSIPSAWDRNSPNFSGVLLHQHKSGVTPQTSCVTHLLGACLHKEINREENSPQSEPSTKPASVLLQTSSPDREEKQLFPLWIWVKLLWTKRILVKSKGGITFHNEVLYKNKAAHLPSSHKYPASQTLPNSVRRTLRYWTQLCILA